MKSTLFLAAAMLIASTGPINMAQAAVAPIGMSSLAPYIPELSAKGGKGGKYAGGKGSSHKGGSYVSPKGKRYKK